MGYPVPPGKTGRLVTVVDEEDGDLPAVTGVDETGAVDDPDPETAGMTTSRKNQARIPRRHRHRDASGYGDPLAGVEIDLDPGVKIDGSVATVGRLGVW